MLICWVFGFLGLFGFFVFVFVFVFLESRESAHMWGKERQRLGEKDSQAASVLSM